jgi:hypothetical protein
MLQGKDAAELISDIFVQLQARRSPRYLGGVLARRGETSASVCDTETLLYLETIALQKAC